MKITKIDKVKKNKIGLISNDETQKDTHISTNQLYLLTPIHNEQTPSSRLISSKSFKKRKINLSKNNYSNNSYKNSLIKSNNYSNTTRKVPTIQVTESNEMSSIKYDEKNSGLPSTKNNIDRFFTDTKDIISPIKQNLNNPDNQDTTKKLVKIMSIIDTANIKSSIDIKNENSINNSSLILPQISKKKSKHKISKLIKTPSLLKLESPNLHKLIYEFDKDIYNRRKAIYIKDNLEVKVFTDAINNPSPIHTKNNSISANVWKVEHTLKQGTALGKIYTKCEKEMKAATEVEKLLHLEKLKQLNNSEAEKQKSLNLQQNAFLLDEETNEKLKGAKSTKFKDSAIDKKEKLIGSYAMELAHIVSEKSAYTNREFLMKKFGYDFHKDEEFIFRDEVIKKFKEVEEKRNYKIENKIKVEKEKHKQVKRIVESNFKSKEFLVNKIKEDINHIKSNRFERSLSIKGKAVINRKEKENFGIFDVIQEKTEFSHNKIIDKEKIKADYLTYKSEYGSPKNVETSNVNLPSIKKHRITMSIN